MQQGYNAERPLGYYQVSADAGGTLTTLGAPPPIGTTVAVIKVEGQAARYRDDNVAPTASVGMPLAVGDVLIYTSGRFGQLQFISQTAGAILNILYYAH